MSRNLQYPIVHPKEITEPKDYYTRHSQPLYIVTRSGIFEAWLYKLNKDNISYSYRMGTRANQKIKKSYIGKNAYWTPKEAIDAYKTMMNIEVKRLRLLADKLEKQIEIQSINDEVKYSGEPVYETVGLKIGRILTEKRQAKKEAEALHKIKYAQAYKNFNVKTDDELPPPVDDEIAHQITQSDL